MREPFSVEFKVEEILKTEAVLSVVDRVDPGDQHDDTGVSGIRNIYLVLAHAHDLDQDN